MLSRDSMTISYHYSKYSSLGDQLAASKSNALYYVSRIILLQTHTSFCFLGIPTYMSHRPVKHRMPRSKLVFHASTHSCILFSTGTCQCWLQQNQGFSTCTPGNYERLPQKGRWKFRTNSNTQHRNSLGNISIEIQLGQFPKKGGSGYRLISKDTSF